jgi:hypothetical protein
MSAGKQSGQELPRSTIGAALLSGQTIKMFQAGSQNSTRLGQRGIDMREYKITTAQAGAASLAFQFFGYENGTAIYQSRKLWRNRADCERAAKKWARKGELI